MGDLIHALPALTDAKRFYPDISFDWVIEKSFSEVASWHPAVNNIIRTSHRQWRRNFIASWKSGEIKNFLHTLRENSYDLIIDGQNSLKSAITCLLAKGPRVGLDKYSARESVASLIYQKKIFVDKDLHAVKRLRLLFAEALGYSYVNDQPDYGIVNLTFPLPDFTLPKRYLFLVHNASWQSKMWPENYWRQLVYYASLQDLHVLLPWGSEAEKNRAMRIAANQGNAIVLPNFTLSQYAAIIQNSEGAICNDTGFAHMAAALNVPAVTIYGSTSVKLIGTEGLNQKHQLSSFSCTECYKYECDFNQQKHHDALCLLAIKPQMVWEKFQSIKIT
jgi:heptosyltransferase-1